MIYKACIFDLDGTLTDTVNSIAYFGNEALKRFGFCEIDTERYKLMAGNGARTLVRRMLKENDCEDDTIFQKVFDYYVKTYNDDFLYKTTVFEGIKQLLGDMKSSGIKIAVLSNKPHVTTKKITDALFGEGFFDACSGSREGVALKPDVAELYAMLDKLGAAPKECLYVGDTGTDMQTGKGGGLFTIGVLWGFRGREELEENGADLIVECPNEIYKYIKRFS